MIRADEDMGPTASMQLIVCAAREGVHLINCEGREQLSCRRRERSCRSEKVQIKVSWSESPSKLAEKICSTRKAGVVLPGCIFILDISDLACMQEL